MNLSSTSTKLNFVAPMSKKGTVHMVPCADLLMGIMILMSVISTVGEIKDVMASGLTGVAPMEKDVDLDMKNISGRAQLYLWE